VAQSQSRAEYPEIGTGTDIYDLTYGEPSLGRVRIKVFQHIKKNSLVKNAAKTHKVMLKNSSRTAETEMFLF